MICDANPASIYYYKTDMGVKEVVQYFKKASLKDDSDFALTHPPTNPIYFSLQATTTNNPIDINYYVDGSQEINSLGLANSDKKHLVTIPSEDYQAAKDAL